MKRRIMIFLAAMCAAAGAGAQHVTDSTWRSDVKTVVLSREGSSLEPPVLTLEGGGSLRLEFDVLSDEAENLRCTLAHCDAEWRRDDLEPYEFMTGFESLPIDDYDFSFTTRRTYVHYRRSLPDRGARFLYSGNYVVTVTAEEGDTLLTRRFWVSEESAKVMAERTRPYDGMEMERRQSVECRVESGENFTLRPEYLRVLVRQNGREDNARWLEFSGYEGHGLAYRHRQANLFQGGNTFRYFDMSNLRTPMYNVQRVEEYGGEFFALLRPEEDRSRKNFLADKSLMGGMKVNAWDRNNPTLEAEYVWVNISLPMAQPMLEGNVYVVGQLTEWKLDSTSRMDYNPQYKAYVKRLLLKQGYYSYQLLVEKSKIQKIEESKSRRLEGDHWETPNEYTIYVYQREPGDRADRLVSVKRIY